ncbi:MAG: hypothetical protein AMJ43_05065 [Coxiella sp. DG_40]|nr:MAG: hypothetical protein AMJ43_05065 [Coxiella sp. DG_40]
MKFFEQPKNEQFILGINYLFGLTEEENRKKTIEYFENAIKSSNLAGLAACCLGMAYLKGTGNVTQEAKSTAQYVFRVGIQDWCLIEKDQKLSIIQICEGGCIEQDFKKAIYYLEQIAINNISDACTLGIAFLTGIFWIDQHHSVDFPKNIYQAIFYLKKAATTLEAKSNSDRQAKKEAAELLSQHYSKRGEHNQAEYFQQIYNSVLDTPNLLCN